MGRNYKGRTYAAPSANKKTTITITAADGKTTKVTEGASTGWGGNSKGGLMGGVGSTYHFRLMLASCCRNSNNGKSLGVNIRDANDNNDAM